MPLNNNIASLDFADIVDDFKTFLGTKDSFKDFDFTGSNISLVIDMLAYGIQKHAMIAHLQGNETHLETAQRRGNVVSYAKNLGYTSHSKKASTAVIDILVENGVGTDQLLTLPKETRLYSVIDGTEYQFVVQDRQTTSRLPNNSFLFKNVKIVQGIRKRTLYRFDERMESPTFVIPEDNVDISTLKVSIKENDSSENEIPYFLFTKLWNVDRNSNLYHIQENYTGKFEVFFGDNVFGNRPNNNNIIVLDYIYTDGEIVNGARLFSMSDTVGGNNSMLITMVEPASGGMEKESIEKIKYIAPLIKQSYDNAVTEQDYIAIIMKYFDNIESITTWGGETNEIPNFGVVNISIKPYNKDTLSLEEKQKIGNTLKSTNVASITPVFIDPEYTFISIDNEFKYVPDNTYKTKSELESTVRNVISKYSDDTLQKFGGVFRLSNLSSIIDKSDNGIVSNINKVYCYKFITPFNNKTNYFELTYTNPIYDTRSTSFSLTSSDFLLNGVKHFFGDKPTDISGLRRVFIYTIIDGKKVEIVSDAGDVLTSSGKVILRNFRPDTTGQIRIIVLPNSDDLYPKKNQLLKILPTYVTATGEIDTILVGGSGYGSQGYTTSSKSRL